MTKGLLFIWDDGWFHPNTELVLWHDLAVSYSVDLLIMIPDLRRYDYQDIEFVKYDTLEKALMNHQDFTFVFLEPLEIIKDKGYEGESLADFVHPEDALYIFGNSGRSNIGFYDKNRGDRLVYVPTIGQKQLWSITVASITLYDRAIKQGLI